MLRVQPASRAMAVPACPTARTPLSKGMTEHALDHASILGTVSVGWLCVGERSSTFPSIRVGSTPLPLPPAARPSLVVVRAQGESPQPSKDEDELRLEALEAATTRKKASAPRMPASAGTPGQRGAQVIWAHTCTSPMHTDWPQRQQQQQQFQRG